MANDLSLDTLQNNKKKTQVIMYLMIGLILIALGATFAGTGTTPALIGGVLAIAGGGYMSYMGYEILVDPKNERRCTKDYFNLFNFMKVPESYINGDVAIDTMTDVDEQTAVVKAQYEGYGGVFLVSNILATSIGGNFDAYFVPGNAKAVLTKKLTDPGTSSVTITDGGKTVTVAAKLYLVKDIKSGNRVVARSDDPNNRIDLTVGSPAPLISNDVCPN